MALFEVSALLPALPSVRPGLAMRWVAAVHVVSLRHLPGGGLQALATAAHPLALPKPGHLQGQDPAWLWCSPNECLMLASDPERARAVMAALPPNAGALAVAIDETAGKILVELRGAEIDALLSRLVDADAVPREAGRGGYVRFADVRVTLARLGQDRLWLMAERPLAQYLALWLHHADEALRPDG